MLNVLPEKASIDEAFIDLTAPVRRILLERYPHIASVPPDAPNGTDSSLPPPPEWIDWAGLGEIIPISGSKTSLPAAAAAVIPPQESSKGVAPEEGDSSEGMRDEADDDISPPEPPPTWHDIALSIGAELMVKLREAVFQELGYTMSAVGLFYCPSHFVPAFNLEFYYFLRLTTGYRS
jgi:DNA polymerase eta